MTGIPAEVAFDRASRRPLFAGFVAAMVLLATLGWFNWRHTVRMQETAALVAHTHEARTELSQMLSLIKDVETGERGFVVTGDPAFLGQFEDSLGKINGQFSAVRTLTRDNPRQQANCDALQPLLTRRLALAQTLVDLRRNSGFDAARQQTAKGEGKVVMGQFRAVIARMQAEEESLLVNRFAAAQREASNTNVLSLTVTGVSLVLFIAVFALVLHENRLRQRAYAKLDRFFTLSLDMLCIANADGYFKSLSPAFTRTLGWSIEELLTRPFLDFVHADDRAATLREVERQVVAGEKVLQFENRYLHKNGSWRVLSWKSVPQSDGMMYAVARDVTEMKEVEAEIRKLNAELEQRVRARTAELHESEAKLNAVIENTGDFVWSVDNSYRLSVANIAFRRWLLPALGREIQNGEVVLADVFPAAVLSQWKGLYDRALRGEVFLEETGSLAEDGSQRYRENSFNPIRNDGAVVGVACFSRDITERKRAEVQLRQSQKMEAVGQLASGIAHDFNNLLTVINGRSELMMMRFNPGDKTRNDLELIYKTGERAAALTRQLLAFSRQQMLQPVVLDLNTVTAGMDTMLRRLIREDINLCTVLDPGLKCVKADPGQIEQVIMNLVVNARDAMPNGGKLTIETANVELSAEYCRTRSDVKPGHYVMLAISDTGHGMDAAVMARIFEPFYTTKPQGKGTGLGLAMVFGVVKQSNGHVAVYSEVGKGTTFKIYLPQTQDKRELTGSKSRLPVVPGQEVILVVEDEEGVRELVRDLLKMNGYSVLMAKNGKEALQVCQEHNGDISLVVTDVVMPEMGGPELIERIKVQNPKMKALFTSGYTDHAVVRSGEIEAGVSFIQKPFTPANFARKVREVIDQS